MLLCISSGIQLAMTAVSLRELKKQIRLEWQSSLLSSSSSEVLREGLEVRSCRSSYVCDYKLNEAASESKK